MSAESGNAEAQFRFGLCCLNGIGLPQNSAEAAKWFALSAYQGYAPGQYFLGVCYYQGEGVAADLDEARRLFKLAAEQGDPQAIEALNKMPPIPK
jgi:TPR repeat protein